MILKYIMCENYVCNNVYATLWEYGLLSSCSNDLEQSVRCTSLQQQWVSLLKPKYYLICCLWCATAFFLGQGIRRGAASSDEQPPMMVAPWRSLRAQPPADDWRTEEEPPCPTTYPPPRLSPAVRGRESEIEGEEPEEGDPRCARALVDYVASLRIPPPLLCRQGHPSRDLMLFILLLFTSTYARALQGEKK